MGWIAVKISNRKRKIVLRNTSRFLKTIYKRENIRKAKVFILYNERRGASCKNLLNACAISKNNTKINYKYLELFERKYCVPLNYAIENKTNNSYCHADFCNKLKFNT